MTFRKLITGIFLPGLVGFFIFSGLAVASSQDNAPIHASGKAATNHDEEQTAAETGKKDVLHGTKTHEAADKTGLSQRTVENSITKLKQAGFLKRVGSPKSGHWKILGTDKNK